DDENRAAISDFYQVCMRELHEKYSIGALIKIEDPAASEVGSFEYLFAKTDYTDALPLAKKEQGLQVTGYHIGKYEAFSDTYEKMFSLIKEHRVKAADHIYGEPILDRISVNDSDKYVTKIAIPVSRE